MKRLATLTGLMMSLAIGASAQLALPYNCGFDNASQKSGWQQFRKGSTANQSWVFSEDFADGFTPPSAPNCITHPYPTGGPTVLTDDWYVSPSLNLTSGGKLSFKIAVFTMAGALVPGDTIQVYLLKGNANPSSASSKTLLGSYASMQSTSHNFKDTNNIVIPATTGAAYIAFRYTAIDDWYTVGIDNIKIIAGATSGINDHKGQVQQLELYPNPAKEILRWSYTGIALPEHTEVQVVDLAGRVLSTTLLKEKQLNISALQPGAYFLKSGAKAVSFIKE